jgi:hypothetical protein
MSAASPALARGVEAATETAAPSPSSSPPPHRSAVGVYRCSYHLDPELHLREFLSSTTSASSIPVAKRANLTAVFRRYRDVDQSDSSLRHACHQLSAIDPVADIGNDVDFACLVLNCHHTFRMAPPSALLDHVAGTIAPRIRTSLQLETIMSAFRDMAGPGRTRDLLTALVPTLDAQTGSMRKEGVVFLACMLVDNGVAPASLLQALQERAVMVCGTMTFHELAQLCLAYAVAPNRPDDIREIFETEYAPNLLKQIDFSFGQDVASVLYAFAEVRVAVPELVARCASRVFMLHQELDSDAVAMTFSALALMEVRAPKLTKALVQLTKELDLASVTSLAALDMAHAMTFLGVKDDVVLSLLTGRIMADRQAVLASPDARARLVQLSERLSAAAESSAGV